MQRWRLEANPHQPYAALTRSLQRRWRWFAMSVPAALLFGESFYGTLTSVEGTHWFLFLRQAIFVIGGGIISLRLLAKRWLRRRVDRRPTAQELEQTERHTKGFLLLAWSFSVIVAGLGVGMFLLAAPRMYAYILELIAVVYFVTYFPRQRFINDLLWYPETE